MNIKNIISTKKKWVAAGLVVLVAAAVGLAAFSNGAGTRNEAPATADDAPADAAAPQGGLAAYDKNGDGVVYQDGMHPWYVQDEPGVAPDCGMDLTPVRVSGAPAGTVEIDPVTLQNMGVRTAVVTVEALGRTVRTTGRFEANEQALAAVSPKVSGWIERLYVNYEGARVRRGQPLLEVYSPELVSTQEEYLLALRNAERLGHSPDARRLVEAARRRLAYWDITEEQVEALAATGTPTKTLTLYAPASGTVTRKRVVEGQQIAAGVTLMELANLSRLWLMVDVYEQDLAWVGVGTDARIELPYDAGRTLTGRVEYLYDDLDPAARTARARISVPNPGLRLKPGMYATVHLVGGRMESMPVVPEEAVLQSGTTAAVIVALGEGRFRPQPVTTGVQADGRVQIISGLKDGERVVTSAQFLIDSEARLQSAISAMMAPTPPPHEGDGHDVSMEGMDMPGAATAAPATAPVQDGVQEVAITVSAAGFTPKEVRLQPGVPARLVFTRTVEGTCAKQVQLPAFGIAPTDLPQGEPVAISFTPGEAGTFTFACGMDMLKGTLVVAPAG